MTRLLLFAAITFVTVFSACQSPTRQADRSILESHAITNATDLDAKHMVVVFGFTTCPDICPTTLLQWESHLASLTPEHRERVELAFVTVDPTRDTSERLVQYVTHFSGDFIPVRAEGDALATLMQSFRVHARKVPARTPGQYSMDHSASAFLIDPIGSVIAEYRYGESQDLILQSLQTRLDT
jgi:protein SCO1/2